MGEAHEIPTNIEGLTRLVIEQRVTLKAKDFEIEHLRLQVARLRRMKFGQSSERFVGDVEQLALLNGGAAAAPPPLDPNPAAEPEPKMPRTKPVRDVLPKHLPRESVVHASPCQCPGCGGKLRKIGTVTTEILEVVPTQLKVRQHLRDKFSCGVCETVVAAPPPAKPIANSYVGASLLAFVVSSKYAECRYRHSAYYTALRTMRQNSVQRGKDAGFTRLYRM